MTPSAIDKILSSRNLNFSLTCDFANRQRATQVARAEVAKSRFEKMGSMTPTQQNTKITRKYAMTRLGKGDYLLPSNDAKWCLRLLSYEEDGSAVRGVWPDEEPIYGTFWRVLAAPMEDVRNCGGDFESVRWDVWYWMEPNRRVAIESGLRSAARQR